MTTRLENQLLDRIRQQRDLLDECERTLQEIADGETFDPQGVAVQMLTKLQKEKADG